MSETLFNQNIDKEYVPLANDLIKFTVILFVVNFLMFISNPGQNRLMGGSYTKLMIYVLLGVITYWLVINKIIKFN